MACGKYRKPTPRSRFARRTSPILGYVRYLCTLRPKFRHRSATGIWVRHNHHPPYHGRMTNNFTRFCVIQGRLNCTKSNDHRRVEVTPSNPRSCTRVKSELHVRGNCSSGLDVLDSGSTRKIARYHILTRGACVRISLLMPLLLFATHIFLL